MKELPADKILLYCGCVLSLIILTPLVHKIPRSGGTNIFYHILYIIFMILACIFTPDFIAHEIYSPGGVLVASTIIPIYESIVSACSIDSNDDRSWLQYWIVSATFHICTEFIDDIVIHLPAAGEHWYEFEFFFTCWLIFPLTDGSGLIYNQITKPYISPSFTTLKKQMEGYGAVLLTAVNAWYLWIAWFAFMRLEEEAKRFLVVALGTVYPIIASTVAMTTSSSSSTTTTTTAGTGAAAIAGGVTNAIANAFGGGGGGGGNNSSTTTSNNNKQLHGAMEETFWLTYWICFMILFIAMDYLENFLGNIPGFFSLIAAAVLYLFLPMFQGSTVIFRRVLVPLTGQYENLLLYDAYIVRRTMFDSIPDNDRRIKIMERAAQIFTAQDGTFAKDKRQ